jgi:rhodanese-related sulfurtransferase
VSLPRKIILTVLILCMTTVAVAYAASSDEVVRVTAQELKTMMNSGTEVVIVDNRPRADFDRFHIKGAIALPWDMDVGPEAKKILSSGKLIVTYCACGPDESDSADVAAQLLDAGFKNVKTLKNGWEAWEAAGYPVEKSPKK